MVKSPKYLLQVMLCFLKTKTQKKMFPGKGYSVYIAVFGFFHVTRVNFKAVFTRRPCLQ